MAYFNSVNKESKEFIEYCHHHGLLKRIQRGYELFGDYVDKRPNIILYRVAKRKCRNTK